MTQHILFRFHRAYDVCLQNVKLLRRLNPGCKVYGMYGGDDPVSKIPRVLRNQLDNLWTIPLDDRRYRWMHGDLCVRWWFKETGHRFKFDHLYLVEWDLLYLKPLKKIFLHIRKHHNYASIHATYAQAKKKNWWWVSGAYANAFADIKAFITETTGKKIANSKLVFGVMPGAIFCRRFLEKFAATPISSINNDEVRFSCYSLAFGTTLVDNGLISNRKNYINCDNEFLTKRQLLHYVRHDADALHAVRVMLPELKDLV